MENLKEAKITIFQTYTGVSQKNLQTWSVACVCLQVALPIPQHCLARVYTTHGWLSYLQLLVAACFFQVRRVRNSYNFWM